MYQGTLGATSGAFWAVADRPAFCSAAALPAALATSAPSPERYRSLPATSVAAHTSTGTATLDAGRTRSRTPRFTSITLKQKSTGRNVTRIEPSTILVLTLVV